jgi:hypothetical protein
VLPRSRRPTSAAESGLALAELRASGGGMIVCEHQFRLRAIEYQFLDAPCDAEP